MYEYFPETGDELAIRVEDRTSQLRDIAESYKRIFRDHDAIMLLIEPDTGRIVDANLAAERFYGHSIAQMTSMLISDINMLDPEQIRFERNLALEESRNFFVFPHRLAGGEIRTVEVHSSPINTERGTLLFSIVHDISERKQAEEKLKQNENFLEQLVEKLPAMIFVKDALTLQFVRLNGVAEQLLGHSREDLLGKDDYDFFPKDQADFFTKNDREVLASGKVREIEEELETRNGIRILNTKKIPIMSTEGHPLFLLGLSSDVTSRKQTEESLRKSEEKLRIVAEYAHDWEYWVAPDGSFIHVSPSCERVTGYKPQEFIENPTLIRNIAFEQDRHIVCDDLLLSKEAPAKATQFRIVTRHGQIRWISHFCESVFGDDGRYLGRRSSNHDVTYEKEMAQELLDAQASLFNSARLESLAVMAGGIAHDFNNQLMVALGNMELALINTDRDSKAKDKILRSIQACQKCANLSNQLLAYTGQKYFQSEHVDLKKVVNCELETLRSSIPESITMDVRQSTDVPLFWGNTDLIKRIVINLVTNSAEAIGDETGQLVIRTGFIDCDNTCLSQSRLDQKPEPGLFVFLEVSDNGCGMDRETQSSMFDPFFSTKFWGRGMGLAETIGTVRSHQGAIMLESEPNQGTTVRVLFPAIPEKQSPVHSLAGIVQKAPVTHQDCPGERTVLLVEDDERVRCLCSELLKLYGLNVVTAADGLEGLELFQSDPEKIDLILLDLIMPRMNGIEAFGEFVRIRPNIKIIISSGFTEEAVSDKLMGASPAGFLHKPYDMESLQQELDRVIGLSL